MNLNLITEKDNNADRKIFEAEISKAFNLLNEHTIMDGKASKLYRLKKSDCLFVVTNKKGFSVRMFCETDTYEVRTGKFADFVKDQPIKNLLFYLMKNQPNEIIPEKK